MAVCGTFHFVDDDLTNRMDTKLTLRPYRAEDLDPLLRVFTDSVHVFAIAEERVQRRGVTFTRFAMAKTLDTA